MTFISCVPVINMYSIHQRLCWNIFNQHWHFKLVDHKNHSLSSYKKRPNRLIVQQLISTHSHILKCSTSSGRVRNNMLPLIANAPEGRLFTNNTLWKILNCGIVWPWKCFLIRFLARSVYCTFITYVQWMCRIYSLIDITKMIWGLARRTCICGSIHVKLASTLTGWKQYFRSRSFHNKTVIPSLSNNFKAISAVLIH